MATKTYQFTEQTFTDTPFPEGKYVGTLDTTRDRHSEAWTDKSGNSQPATDRLSLQFGDNEPAQEGGQSVGNRKYFVDFTTAVYEDANAVAPTWDLDTDADDTTPVSIRIAQDRLAKLAKAWGVGENGGDPNAWTVDVAEFAEMLKNGAFNGQRVGFRNYLSKGKYPNVGDFFAA